MFELPMTTLRCHEDPAILLQQSYELPYFRRHSDDLARIAYLEGQRPAEGWSGWTDELELVRSRRSASHSLMID